MPVFNYDKLSKVAKAAITIAIIEECDEETSKAIMKRLEDMGGQLIDSTNLTVGNPPDKKSPTTTKTGGRTNSWIVFKKKMYEEGMKDPKEVSELWKSMDEDDKAEYVKIAEDINKRNLSKDSSDDGSNKGSDDSDEDARGTGIKKDKKVKKDKKSKKVKKDSPSDKPSDSDVPPPHPNGALAKKLAKKKNDESKNDESSSESDSGSDSDSDTDNED